MKKLIFMLSAVIFLFAACEKEVDSVNPITATSESGFHKDVTYPDGDPCITTKMIADGGKHDEDCSGIWVGNIKVWDDDSKITVIYEINEPVYPGWVIDATQLYVGDELLIPATNKGNPKIGKFPFKGEYDPAETVVEFILTGDDYPDAGYVISAHADVRYDVDDPIGWTMETFCTDLPETAELFVARGGAVSYMQITVSAADWLNGVYEGWCIDEEHGIVPGLTYYFSDVYCTTNGDANHLVHPNNVDNFDNLNWLLNQDFVGKISTCDPGVAYTVLDVQYAIWYLMDDYEPPLSEQNCRQKELEVLALTEGEHFKPGCGDYVAVAFDPSYGEGDDYVERQKVIIKYPLTCDQEETAWGYGYNTGGDQCDTDGPEGWSFTESSDYGGSAWGWYFYGCQPLP